MLKEKEQKLDNFMFRLISIPIVYIHLTFNTNILEAREPRTISNLI